jgi:pimeloyl-ACP methyl ester carboxylesterase
MENWKSHKELAEALSDTFSVYLPDRRGRGLSSSLSDPSNEAGSMQAEIDDLEALASETGARFVFGVSSGALISLETALERPHLFSKIALFEPPLLLDRERFGSLRSQFLKELDGDTVGAAITAMDMIEMGPWLVRVLPRWASRPLVNWAFSYSDAKGLPQDWADGEVADGERETLRSLIPTLQTDFNVVEAMNGALNRCASLKDSDVLLLSGTASRPYLIHSVEELERVVPNAKHSRLQGLDHLGCGNKNTGGNALMVAEVLKEFFHGARA